MTEKKVPHVHAELIKQWADGAQIQYKDNENWYDVNNRVGPQWTPTTQYRVKPEPKPDVIRYAVASKLVVQHVGPVNTNPCNNLMLIFDGETGKLKDAQVLASSGE